jgi:hypothetical protein
MLERRSDMATPDPASRLPCHGPGPVRWGSTKRRTTSSNLFFRLKDRCRPMPPENSDEQRNDRSDALDFEQAERVPEPKPESDSGEQRQQDQTEQDGDGNWGARCDSRPVADDSSPRNKKGEEQCSYRPNGTLILRQNSHSKCRRNCDAHKIEEIVGIERSPSRCGYRSRHALPFSLSFLAQTVFPASHKLPNGTVRRAARG